MIILKNLKYLQITTGILQMKQSKEAQARKLVAIVPQLSKCLKFEAVWGALTDQMI